MASSENPLTPLFREFLDILSMPDVDEKAARMKSFFEKLNSMRLPGRFNWARDVFEKIHLPSRESQEAIVWVNLEDWSTKTITYRGLVEESNRLVNYLRGHGLGRGSRVYVMLPLLPELFYSTYAAVKAGFTMVPTATVMTVRELEYRFKVFPPDAVIADEASAKVVDEALELTNSRPKVKLIVGGDREGWESFDEIGRESPLAEPEDTRSDDIVFAFFTSGTTGPPKIVAHTATSYPVGHLSTAMIVNARPGRRHNNLSAPGWAKYAWSTFFVPFISGATTVALYYSKGLPADRYLQAIDELKVSSFCAPPTAWRLFRARVNIREYSFEALEDVVSAGEPLNPELYQWFREATGREIRDFYGQTETTAMIGNPPWFKGGRIKPGSFGKPTFMYDIVLLDDEGREITKPGEVGHIAVRLTRWRPIGLMAGYIGRPDKMKEVFQGDYYLTGDKAYFDGDGYWWFVGRADDVIKSSDYRIGPFEVESALIEHPAVAEAAVVGSPDPVRYQLVKAFIVLKPGYKPSEELAVDIFRHALKLLPRYKIPRIIEFVEELPKTISGKIQRYILRKMEQERKAKGERGKYEYFYEELKEKILSGLGER